RVPAHGAPDALARAVVAERDRADVALVRLVPRDAVVATATAGLGLAATGGVRAGVVAVTVARRGGLGRGAHRRSPIRVSRPGGRAWRALACCRGVVRGSWWPGLAFLSRRWGRLGGARCTHRLP